MSIETPLLKARKYLGLTSAQVADALGIERGNYSRIERGLQIPHLNRIDVLVDYYRDIGLDRMMVLYPDQFAHWKPRRRWRKHA